MDVLRFWTLKSEVVDVTSERGIIRVGRNANPLSLLPTCSIVSFPTNYQYPIGGRFGFNYATITPFAVVATAPDWFAILFCAILGGTTWIRWPKRFSLRTLLIATTLVAVVLGLIVWATRQ
jgi:hypothetical protein